MSPSRSPRWISVLALGLALSACDDAGRYAEDKAESATAQTAAVDADVAMQAEAPPSVDDIDAPADRMVIRTARIQIRAESPAQVVAHAIELAESGGGFVSNSESHGVGDDVDLAQATLRFPSNRFEGMLAELRGEGELLSEQLGGDDVTEQYVDLSARLRSQRKLEERLLDILDKVESVDDALSVEAQLTRVRTDIERLDGQKRSLEDRVSFATIDLSVSSPVRHNAPQAETVVSRLDRALDDAGRAFVAVLAGLIRILGVLLPLGLVFVPIGIAARGAWRRRRARHIVPVAPPATTQLPPPPLP